MQRKKKDTWSQMTMSNITTIGNQQNTLILLTCSPLSGFSLYKYTIETHIKTLKAQVQGHA